MLFVAHGEQLQYNSNHRSNTLNLSSANLLCLSPRPDSLAPQRVHFSDATPAIDYPPAVAAASFRSFFCSKVHPVGFPFRRQHICAPTHRDSPSLHHSAKHRRSQRSIRMMIVTSAIKSFLVILVFLTGSESNNGGLASAYRMNTQTICMLVCKFIQTCEQRFLLTLVRRRVLWTTRVPSD